MAIDPFALLELDHRHVEHMLEELSDSEEGPERENALNELEQSLAVHMEFEEQAVYPLVSQEIDAESAREAEIEHGLARDGLSKLRQLVAAPGFGAAVEMLKGGISHHVEEEEGEMFPQLRSKTSADILRRLAGDVVAGKKAAGLPVVPPEATKQQLMEMARGLAVEGRSSMTRDELADSIAASLTGELPLAVATD